jgi:pimeloyl-ACP methyl ester carboxylesterase
VARKTFLASLVLIVALAALFFVGPRVPADTAVTFNDAALGDDVAAYLGRSEAQAENLREGLGKEIVWAFPQSRAKTPLSIVYVHGFSASKGETRPLCDKVAAALGANLFYTRLTGHGQDGPAMATATVHAWVNDLAEALAIGRVIGNKVIVIATSTGGGLATWAAAQPDFMTGVAGLVLISPNYQPRARGAAVLTMPWGGQIAQLVSGRERGFTPANDLQARFWTTRYPTTAVLPMAAMTRLARQAQVENINIPALFIFSEHDAVVYPRVTRDIAAHWGAPHETFMVETTGDPSNHVIAGDAFSPSTTDLLADKITTWIRATVD